MSPPRLFELPDDPAVAPEVLAGAAAALAEGGVLALPTETVYGLAARADDPAALERLGAIKGSAAARPFTWHVGKLAPVLASEPPLAGLITRLAERYWPGPLTLVLACVPPGLERVAREGWTGVRLPAHAGTRALLASLEFPVVATSANRAGGAPLIDAAAVAGEFGGELAAVLDGGPCRLGESSSVLALGPGRFELLREGLFDLEELKRSAGLRVLFVCTGNTCRSPMAQVLAQRLLEQRLGSSDIAAFGFEVSSAGVCGGGGTPATAHAVAVMRERGLDLSEHGSRAAIAEEVAAADRVYGLTGAHCGALVEMLPPREGGHIALLDELGRDVPDPIGGDRGVYRSSAEVIAAALEPRVAEWIDGQPRRA